MTVDLIEVMARAIAPHAFSTHGFVIEESEVDAEMARETAAEIMSTLRSEGVWIIAYEADGGMHEPLKAFRTEAAARDVLAVIDGVYGNAKLVFAPWAIADLPSRGERTP